MCKKTPITLLLFLLMSVMISGVITSCSQYNSDSVGTSFYPSNSQVRLFTHPVYVEFSQNEAPRVWGPYINEVDVSINENHVSLKNTSDSLALFVYGYPALDGISTTDNSLTIESNQHFALYLNKLQLRSVQQPAIRSIGTGTCYLVVPKGSNNSLLTASAPSTFEHNGTLVITGEGKLSLTNESSSDLQPVALSVKGGLLCQYAVSIDLSCPEGNTLTVSDGPIRSSLGSWTFEAGQHAISNPTDSIVLIAGSYSGVAHRGKFFSNEIGTVIRQAKVSALSAQASDLLDTLVLHQFYDSTFVALQQHFDSLTVEADSSLVIVRKGENNKLATFVPHYEMKHPWVLISSSTLSPNDTLTVLP